MNLLIAIDIDGCIADVEKRHILAGPEPTRKNKEEYVKWLKRVQNKKSLLKDKPIPGMIEFTRLLGKNSIYLTSRSEVYREVTKKWLKKHKFPDLPLYMRKKNDWNCAGKYKEAVIFSLIKKNTKVVVLDDDIKKDLEKICRKNRWTMLKALSGS